MISEPTTDIIGGPDLYIDRGSTINLTCVVLYSPEPPAYIFWNHNDAVSILVLKANCIWEGEVQFKLQSNISRQCYRDVATLEENFVTISANYWNHLILKDQYHASFNVILKINKNIISKLSSCKFTVIIVFCLQIVYVILAKYIGFIYMNRLNNQRLNPDEREHTSIHCAFKFKKPPKCIYLIY